MLPPGGVLWADGTATGAKHGGPTGVQTTHGGGPRDAEAQVDTNLKRDRA